MSRVQRKSSLLAIGALLICGGVGAGVLVSELTSDAIVWRATPQIPTTAPPVETAVDQKSAGQAWARTAFDGGLRQCPQINAEFLAACQAEIKALSERPALAYGSYGGPLLITKVEPVESTPEPEAYVPESSPTPEWRETAYDSSAAEAEPDQFAERTPDNYPAEAPHE